MHKAFEAVKQAEQNPEQWFGDKRFDDQVLFANGVYTVGSNGDFDDYDASTAVTALQDIWNEQAANEIERRLSDEAIEAWHEGEDHPEIEKLLEKYPEGWQVWGSRSGSEPLGVSYPA